MRRLFWLNFFSLLLVIVALAEWVCATWLLREIGGIALPASWHVLGPALIYLFNRVVVTRSLPPPGPWRTFRRAYTGVAFTSLFGLMFLSVTGVLWLAVSAAVSLVALISGSAISLTPVVGAVRLFATTGLVGICATMGYGYLFGQRRLWVNRVGAPVKGLPSALDGFRIAQISDVHLGGFTSPARIARYVERVNRLDPDLVVITGDITDGLDHAPETFPVLGGLRARKGVIAILGNHDVYTGADEVTDALREHTAFRVLLDDIDVVREGEAGLYVIGLRDRGLDWARGVRECPVLAGLHEQVPQGAPVLLLTHRPDLFDHAVELDIPVVLAGHTHGGQVAVPLRRGRAASLARFMTRFPRGTYRSADSLLHVNLGLGVTGQPVRLATPREITLITLEAAANPAG